MSAPSAAPMRRRRQLRRIPTTALPSNLDGVELWRRPAGAASTIVTDGWVLRRSWGTGPSAARSRRGRRRTAPTLDMPNLGTLRARAGYTLDDTLFYVTGGLRPGGTGIRRRLGVDASVTAATAGWAYGLDAGRRRRHRPDRSRSRSASNISTSTSTTWTTTDRRPRTATVDHEHRRHPHRSAPASTTTSRSEPTISASRARGSPGPLFRLAAPACATPGPR